MNKRSLGALVALNIALLVALAVVALVPQPAAAQAGFVRSQYITVAGDASGRQEQAIYVIEINTGKIAALIYNSGNKSLDAIDGRSILDDLAAANRK
jgi:hypothetical protein